MESAPPAATPGTPSGEVAPDAATAPPRPEAAPSGWRARLGLYITRHGRKFWWLHSLYALALGTFVVLFAQKGFRYARWLTISLAAVWLLLILFFRLVGEGPQQNLQTKGAKLRFLVMTYVLKNLYQGMLFFLLPFYWKSSTVETPNFGFMVVLGVCSILATMDVIFDRVLMRRRLLASVYYMVALFACSNLVIQALLPHTPVLWTMLAAAIIAVVAFFTLHYPLDELQQPRGMAMLAAALAAALSVTYAARRVVPPVPHYVARAAVGPVQLPDGRLVYEVTALHSSVMTQMVAVTDVVSPAGIGESFRHVWRHEGREIARFEPRAWQLEGVEGGGLRLRSTLAASQRPPVVVGRWTVDVETEHGQLVGRARFRVED